MALFLVLVSLGSVLAQTGSPSAPTATTLNPPAQPTSTGLVGGFEIIGNSLVSAQQLFLGTPDKVFVLDKVENNAASINGHPLGFLVYLSQAAFHKFEDQLRARDVEEQKGLHRRHSALLRYMELRCTDEMSRCLMTAVHVLQVSNSRITSRTTILSHMTSYGFVPLPYHNTRAVPPVRTPPFAA
ncbi:hypothetical protein C8R47DRAFT_1229673 [Mycena vitilis]|nr:hypothetical protein C8R47DRAFT_1229673 [Mycena vitilis]